MDKKKIEHENEFGLTLIELEERLEMTAFIDGGTPSPDATFRCCWECKPQ